jgi:hypothetical protein
MWQGQFERQGKTRHETRLFFWLHSYGQAGWLQYTSAHDGGFCNGCVLKQHWHLSEHLFTNVAYNDLVSQLSGDKILQ